MPPPGDIAENLAVVKGHMAAAADAAGRAPEDVRLVAVTKAHPADAARAALAAGHRLFGENRVQEGEAKWPGLKARFPDARLHLIGPLQRNKARAAVQLFDVIETVDRPRLATHLARLMDETGRRPDCLIQVNTGAEPQKAGVLPGDADGFIAECREGIGLPVRGLMCIPPAGRGAGAAFRPAGGNRRAQRARRTEHGDERRLRGRHPVRRDPGAGGNGGLRAAGRRRGLGSGRGSIGGVTQLRLSRASPLEGEGCGGLASLRALAVAG